MSKFFKVASRVLATVLIAAGLILTFSTFTQNTPKKLNIMFIAKSSASNFWKTAFKGAHAAANEYNVNISIRSPQSEDDYITQNELLQWGIDNKVDAIIFSACDYDRSVYMAESAIDAGITLISIDSPINSKRIDMFTGTDNLAAGAKAAAELALRTGYKGVVGVINCEEAGAVGMQREKGFVDELKKYTAMQVVDIRYTASNIEDPKQKTLKMLEEHPEINAIAAFNEWATLGVGAALQQLSEPLKGDARMEFCQKYSIVGFDTNVLSIEQLEDGILDALIVQNPFAMGYLGVQQAIEYKKTTKHTAFTDTGTTVITSENMYDSENQKLLFPFS
ncbi:MAG: substrate-binding domain-containing protein [Hydrogenoanaerobacterium sp.]